MYVCICIYIHPLIIIQGMNLFPDLPAARFTVDITHFHDFMGRFNKVRFKLVFCAFKCLTTTEINNQYDQLVLSRELYAC